MGRKQRLAQEEGSSFSIIHDDILYQVSGWVAEEKQENFDEIKQIISTFTFIDTNQTSKQWKPYINKQYGFSLQHPTSWQVQDMTGNDGSIYLSNADNPQEILGKVFEKKYGIVTIEYKPGPMPTGFPFSFNIDTKQSTINGYKAVLGRETSPLAEPPFPSVEKVYLKHPKDGYFIIKRQLHSEAIFDCLYSGTVRDVPFSYKLLIFR